MRQALFVFVAMGLRAAAGAAEGADFSPERWNFRAAASAVEEKLGRRSLFLRGGHAYYQDVAFADGWLEVDLAFPRQRTFGGVLFRVVAEGHQEKIYLRPHKSGLDDALQYEAVFDGSTTWQLYSAPTYMRPLDIPKEEWCRLRVVFSGDEAKVYFDGDPEPAMVVSDLKRDYAKGGIGLWAGPGGAWFSNLRYSAAPEAPPPPRTEAALHPGIVQRWELSEAFAAEDALPERLPAISGWQPVGVEPPGILVIDRYRKSSSTLPPSMEYVQRLGRANGRRIVYARAVVESQSEQVKRMSFGYSDEVSIFLNGRILFTGRSAFRFRDPGFMGVMDVENDAVYLPLAKGRNEIVVGVAEFFGGWGLTARFDDPAGLQLP